MADCFSLPNVAELAEMLRTKCEDCEDCLTCAEHDEMLQKAADVIEQLLTRIGQDDAEYCALSCALTELDEKYDALEKENEELKEQAQRGSDYHILKAERDGFKQENAKLKAELDAALHDTITDNANSIMKIRKNIFEGSSI